MVQAEPARVRRTTHPPLVGTERAPQPAPGVEVEGRVPHPVGTEHATQDTQRHTPLSRAHGTAPYPPGGETWAGDPVPMRDVGRRPPRGARAGGPDTQRHTPLSRAHGTAPYPPGGETWAGDPVPMRDVGRRPPRGARAGGPAPMVERRRQATTKARADDPAPMVERRRQATTKRGACRRSGPNGGETSASDPVPMRDACRPSGHATSRRGSAARTAHRPRRRGGRCRVATLFSSVVSNCGTCGCLCPPSTSGRPLQDTSIYQLDQRPSLRPALRTAHHFVPLVAEIYLSGAENYLTGEGIYLSGTENYLTGEGIYLSGDRLGRGTRR